MQILTEIVLGRCTRRADITPMKGKIGSLTLRNKTDRHGKTYPLTASTDEGKENISIPHDQPRASSRINDNYCVTSLWARLLAGSTPKETLTVQSLKTNVNLNVVNHVHSATGHPQRKGISPGLSAVISKDCTLKHVKGASVIQLPCVQSVTNVPLVVKKSACWGQTSKLLANLAGKRCQTENSSNLERGLHPPLSDPAKPHKVSHCHKQLCQSPQEQLPAGGITSAYGQKCNRTGPQSNIFWVFQPAFSGTQTQQQVEAYTGPNQTKSFPQGGEVQNGDTRNHQDIPPARGVGNLS